MKRAIIYSLTLAAVLTSFAVFTPAASAYDSSERLQLQAQAQNAAVAAQQAAQAAQYAAQQAQVQ
jgi:hypothetical protein